MVQTPAVGADRREDAAGTGSDLPLLWRSRRKKRSSIIILIIFITVRATPSDPQLHFYTCSTFSVPRKVDQNKTGPKGIREGVTSVSDLVLLLFSRASPTGTHSFWRNRWMSVRERETDWEEGGREEETEGGDFFNSTHHKDRQTHKDPHWFPWFLYNGLHQLNEL